MAGLMTLDSRSHYFPGDLVVASLGPGRWVSLDKRVVESFFPELQQNVSSMLAFGRQDGLEVENLARRISNLSSHGSNVPVIGEALELIFYNLAQMQDLELDRIESVLWDWMAGSAISELKRQAGGALHFPRTLNRLRGLLAICNVLHSTRIARLLYDFFRSQYGGDICASCSKKAAFRLALLLFSLHHLSDRELFSGFRQILQGNRALFSRRSRMQRFINPRSHQLWDLLRWVNFNINAESFDSLPETLARFVHSRDRASQRRSSVNPRSRPISWHEGRELLTYHAQSPRRRSLIGSFDRRRRSEYALDMVAHEFESLNSRLTDIEYGQEEVNNKQDMMLDCLLRQDRRDDGSNGEVWDGDGWR
jgi:hypothetical protein